VLSYITALNLVRLGIKQKRKFIKIPKNNRSTALLKILIKSNTIYGWSITQTKNKVNYLVYCNHDITNIHTFVTINRKLVLKYKNINMIAKRYASATIFLSTSYGIMSITEAYKKKIGGFLIFRII
jgi:ribosomal protein S8